MWRQPAKWNQWAETGVCLACRGKGFTFGPDRTDVLKLKRGEPDPPPDREKLPCRDCEATGRVKPYRARVFCASLSDVFEDWPGMMIDHEGHTLFICPDCGNIDDVLIRDNLERTMRCNKCVNAVAVRQLTMADLRRRLFELIDNTPWLDWQLVTKRPENVRRMWDYSRKIKGHVTQNEGDGIDAYRKNVWLLTSVSNQKTADVQIPELLKCRDLVPVLGLSAEPLLGPIDLTNYLTEPPGFALKWLSKYYLTPEGKPSEFNEAADGKEITAVVKDPLPIDWIIAGGESGPGARPAHPDWVRMLRDQCVAAGIPFFMKQWGEHAPITTVSGKTESPFGYDVASGLGFKKVGKTNAGRTLDGKIWDEFPKVHL